MSKIVSSSSVSKKFISARLFARVALTRSTKSCEPATSLDFNFTRLFIQIPRVPKQKPACLFFFHIERGSFEVGPKNSLMETRSSGVRGVALGKVSLANHIKSSTVL
jgi:hypothetical protein